MIHQPGQGSERANTDESAPTAPIAKGSVLNLPEGRLTVRGISAGKVVGQLEPTGGGKRVPFIQPLADIERLIGVESERSEAPMFDPTPAEVDKHARLVAVYRRLTEEERSFVSTRWDEDHDLKPWPVRISDEEDVGKRAIRRRWLT